MSEKYRYMAITCGFIASGVVGALGYAESVMLIMMGVILLMILPD